MPILDVEMVTVDGRIPAARVTGELADAAGRVLAAPPGTAWVRMRGLTRAAYAENGGGPPPGVLPVFVTVLRARLSPLPERAREARELAAAVGRILARPVENVHVIFAPEAAGNVAFGGRLEVP